MFVIILPCSCWLPLISTVYVCVCIGFILTFFYYRYSVGNVSHTFWYQVDVSKSFLSCLSIQLKKKLFTELQFMLRLIIDNYSLLLLLLIRLCLLFLLFNEQTKTFFDKRVTTAVAEENRELKKKLLYQSEPTNLLQLCCLH